MRCVKAILHTTNVLVSDTTESRCCLIECYLTPDCKRLLSSKCSDVPVECAMGTLRDLCDLILNLPQCTPSSVFYRRIWLLLYYYLVSKKVSNSFIQHWHDAVPRQASNNTRSSAVAPRDVSCHWIFRPVTQGHSRSFEMTLLSRACASPY